MTGTFATYFANTRKSLTASILVCALTLTVFPSACFSFDDILYARVQNDHAKFSNAFNRLFVQADHPYQFLGEPSLAAIEMPGKDDSFDYYLAAIPFNVPMIKKNLPFHYKYVRLDGRLHVLKGPLKAGIKAPFSRLKILSIYPTNSTINATMQSTHTLTETIQPQWAGASAGSIENSNSDVLSYALQLPVMAGISAPYCPEGARASGELAELRWTVYPAKKQQIMVGNRLGLALIAVEKVPHGAADERKLWFEGALSYALTLGPPFSTSKYRETWEFPLTLAGSLKQLLAAHAMDFPSDDLAKILKTNFDKADKDTKFSIARIGRERAAMIETNSGDVQEITRDGLTDLPSFNKRWSTIEVGGAIWNLMTSYDPDQKLVVCRCLQTMPITGAPVAVIGKSIHLLDPSGKVPAKVITLGCVSQSTEIKLGQRRYVFEGSSAVNDDEFSNYQNWSPL